MKIQRIDHVGVIVKDLAAAKAFFLELGLEVLGEGAVAGAWLDRVVGLHDVHVASVMLGTPDGQAHIELITFSSPPNEQGIERPAANTLGIRHIAFAVEDIEAVVAKLKQQGTEERQLPGLGHARSAISERTCYQGQSSDSPAPFKYRLSHWYWHFTPFLCFLSRPWPVRILR